MLTKVDEEKIKRRIENRACPYKEKVFEIGRRKIVKACLEERGLGLGGGKRIEKRKRYFNRNGRSRKSVRRAYENGMKLEHKLTR